MQACCDNYCFGQNFKIFGGKQEMKISVKVEFRLNDGKFNYYC